MSPRTQLRLVRFGSADPPLGVHVSSSRAAVAAQSLRPVSSGVSARGL